MSRFYEYCLERSNAQKLKERFYTLTEQERSILHTVQRRYHNNGDSVTGINRLRFAAMVATRLSRPGPLTAESVYRDLRPTNIQAVRGKHL